MSSFIAYQPYDKLAEYLTSCIDSGISEDQFGNIYDKAVSSYCCYNESNPNHYRHRVNKEDRNYWMLREWGDETKLNKMLCQQKQTGLVDCLQGRDDIDGTS